MEEKEKTYSEEDKKFAQELIHAGVKGMKWGQRRYQNKDGTLTEAGKRRYGKNNKTDDNEKSSKNKKEQKSVSEKSNSKVDIDKMSTKDIKELNKRSEAIKKYYEHNPTVKQKQIKKLEDKSDIADEVAKTAREASNLSGNMSKMFGASKKTRREISAMSDEELRKKINRQTMEQQYANMNPSRVSRGAARVGTTLAVVGSLAAITAGVLSTAASIKKLKE